MRFLRRHLAQLAIATVVGAPGPASLAGAHEHTAALKASIVGEKDGTLVDALSQEEKAQIYDHLERVLNEVELELDIEIRVVRNLGTFVARPPCRSAQTFVLDVDRRMYDDLRRSGEKAVEFVLAHEVSHFLQYLAEPELVETLCRGEDVEPRPYELLADFAAGYISYALYGADNDFRLLNVLADLADYEFTRVDHHGTTTQRISANGWGASAKHYGKPLNMAKLLSNRQRFEDLLFLGAPQPTYAEQEQAYLKSLEELYR